jgi:hypothetical protein
MMASMADLTWPWYVSIDMTSLICVLGTNESLPLEYENENWLLDERKAVENRNTDMTREGALGRVGNT